MFNSFNRYDDSVKSANRNLNQENQGLTDGRTKNRLKNFFYILPLVFLILALVFAGIMLHHNQQRHKKIDEANDAMKYLGKNLDTNLIADVKGIASTATCETGYSQEKLGFFKGVDEGCLCTDGTTHSKAYCSSQSDPSKCKYTSGISSADYNVFQKTKICTKKLDKWAPSTTGANCDNNYKKCQANVCVLSTVDCPVSKVTFTPADNAAGSITKDIGTTAGPIVSFEASISKAPCAANTQRVNQIDSKNVYPLDTVKARGCGKYGSVQDFSDSVGTDTYANFYKDNALDNGVNGLPFYNTYYKDTDKVNLYAVRRAPLTDKKECVDIAPSKLDGLLSTISEQNEAIYVISIIVIVLAVIGLILAVLFLLFRHKVKFLNSTKGLLLIILIAVLVAICGIVLFSIYQSHEDSNDVSETKASYKGYNDNRCFDQIPGFKRASNDIVGYAEQVKHNVGYLIIALFVASLAFLVFLAVAIGLRKSQKMSPIPDPAV